MIFHWPKNSYYNKMMRIVPCQVFVECFDSKRSNLTKSIAQFDSLPKVLNKSTETVTRIYKNIINGPSI